MGNLFVPTYSGNQLMKVILNALLLTLATGPLSLQAQNSASQEFQNQAKSLGDSISNDNSGESQRCRDLGLEVQRLKGRPQQRASASQIYEYECRRGGTSYYNSGDGPVFHSELSD